MTTDDLTPAVIPDRARSEEPDAVMARKIAGVKIERIPGHHDHRGSLFPFIDFATPFWADPPAPIVHGYLFTIRPGRIKGWGLHKKQADRYFVLSGSLRVVLYDARADSPDQGNVCEFFFTPQSAGLVHIPPGVWHATQNWGKTLGRVANFPTVRFNPEDPDKYRTDVHGGTVPFDWTLRDF
jgi:dTDP-4-dehydrorhamnose 3,5-epimerase